MQFRKETIQREIDAAAVALGFPRRASLGRVERELARYCPRTGKPELDFKDAPARFQAGGQLFILMLLSRDPDDSTANLKKAMFRRAARVRQHHTHAPWCSCIN